MPFLFKYVNKILYIRNMHTGEFTQIFDAMYSKRIKKFIEMLCKHISIFINRIQSYFVYTAYFRSESDV